MIFYDLECPECQHVHSPKRGVRGGSAYSCKGCGLLMYRPKDFTEPVVNFHEWMSTRNPMWPSDGVGEEPVDPPREPRPIRLPRAAKYGRYMYEVLHYAGDNHFVLMRAGARVTVHRDRFTFIK